MTTTNDLIAQYFGFFNGVPKDHYAQIVSSAPFDRCDVLILAFVHAVERDGVYVAEFTNWRDSNFGPAQPGDTDSDRVELVVKAARAKNPDIEILISLGWGSNDAGNAAGTPTEFAASVAALAQTYSLDGFDIDFESTTTTAEDMLALAEALTARLTKVTPQRAMITTITPAQTDGLDKTVLEAFTYTMPQSYQYCGNGTTVTWYEEQLGSYDRIVYGVNSEGCDGDFDDPKPVVADVKANGAAGVFAWRLDNDSVDQNTGYPTFAIGDEIWELLRESSTVS
jgi:Glycosyl hydrolases family 18